MCQIQLRSDGRVEKGGGVQTDRQRDTATLYSRSSRSKRYMLSVCVRECVCASVRACVRACVCVCVCARNVP